MNQKRYLSISSFYLLLSFFFSQGTQNMAPFTLFSNAFKNNETIPARYTCDGENISPDLQWHDAPVGTKSFALIVEDPDAPGKTFVHWIVFNILATETRLTEKTSEGNYIFGLNDFNNSAWGGPCPPSGTHHYIFTLYALDTLLKLPSTAQKKELLAAMKGHILGTAQTVGLYTKNGY